MQTKNKALYFIIAIFFQVFPEGWSLSALPGNRVQNKEVPWCFQWLCFPVHRWMILFVIGSFQGICHIYPSFPVKTTALTWLWKENPSLLLSGTATLMLSMCLCSGASVVSRKWGDLPGSNSANLRPEWPSSSAFHWIFNTGIPWAIECPTRSSAMFFCWQSCCGWTSVPCES